MLQTHIKTIDGVEFKVTEFAGRRAVATARKIGLIISSATKNADLDPGKGMDQSINIGAIAETVLQNADDAFIDQLLESTFANDRPVKAEFDELFAGVKCWRLLDVIWFVIQKNYGDFSALTRYTDLLVGEVSGSDKA